MRRHWPMFTALGVIIVLAVAVAVLALNRGSGTGKHPAADQSPLSSAVTSGSGGATGAVSSGASQGIDAVSASPVVSTAPNGSVTTVIVKGGGGAVVVNGGGGSHTSSSPHGTPTVTTSAPSGTPTVTVTTSVSSPTTTGTRTLHILPTNIRASLIFGGGSSKLDYQAAARYGEANLSNGFSPDPYSVGTTSGGNVNVSYLGGSCSGFASTAPDLRVNFGGGGSSLLRLYYVGSNGDPAMVINDPYGNYYCVDDSFGTVNPTIDFNNPAGGTYDVWIASYASSATISGTFYITENSGNHP